MFSKAFRFLDKLKLQVLPAGIAVLTFVLLSGAAPALAATSVLLTADTEGHALQCQTCPDKTGLGGLSRRATLISDARQKQADILVLDAGNALFGAEGVRDGGKGILAAYDAMGYDAVNLSYRDFRDGKAATTALISAAKLKFVSANVLDDATGAPIAAPYIVKAVGGRKLAVIGVTQAPAALAVLPELRHQLEGVRIQPPVEALAAWLPKARAESDRVLLLYYGSPAGLKPIIDKFGAEVSAVLVGGTRGAEFPAGSATPVLSAEKHGTTVGHLVLADSGAPTIEQLTVGPELKDDAAVAKIVAPYAAPVEVVAAQQTRSPAPADNSLPAPAVGRLEVVTLETRNDAASLAVRSIGLLDRIGDAVAPAGTKLLVIDTEWRNLQTPRRVNDQVVPVQYKVTNLADHLYAVADGRTVLRHSKLQAEGLLPFDQLSLEKENQSISGKVVFDVPADQPPAEVTLRFYDFAKGHMALRLFGAAPKEASPLSPPQKNVAVEAAVFGAQKLPSGTSAPADEGTSLLAIDLRARSVLTYEANAADYDPNAKKGDKIRIGTVADWKESRKYVQLVVDGEYAYPPLDQSDLAPEPRFLPDIFTGGTLVFRVPDSATSLELRCDFPNAKLPDGTVIRPEGLTLPIQGTRPSTVNRPAIASANDEVFLVNVTGQAVADEFAGKKAPAGKRFLVLDLTVQNNGKQQEFFQPLDQLKYVSESGEIVPADEATSHGPHPVGQLLYIPAGEHRSFQMAYAIAATQTRPRLAYSAVTQGASKVLMLQKLGGEAVASATPPPAQPPAVTSPPPSTENHAPAPAAQPPMKSPAPANPATPRPNIAKAPKITALPRQHGAPRGIEGVGLTAEQVNAAIDKGARALWEQRKKAATKERREFGQDQPDVLAALAMVHADAHKKIPEFDGALRHYLSTVNVRDLGASGRGTYEVGLLSMLLQAYGDPAYESKMRQVARWLLEAEGSDGTWTYSADLPEALFKQVKGTGVLQISGGLPPGSAETETWQRQTKPKEIGGDNSVTQFAILGLQSAAANGIKFPPQAWQPALDRALKRQSTEDGSWDYHDASRGYGSMTSAGVCAVAIGRFQNGVADFTQDPAIDHGVAWLDQHFAVGSHPNYSNPNDYVYYFMYSLERVGRILNTEFIGAHEWYPEGAAWLIANQQPGGMWVGKDGDEKQQPELATSFALLFLTRATPPLKPEVKHGPGTLRTAVVAPDNRFYIILDASGSMLDTMDGQMKFDIARGAVQSLIDSLPPNCDVALRVYGHRKSALQPDCDTDTELKIPMEKLDKAKFTATLNSLRSRGKTPLALSIEDAIQDLGEVPADKPITLLLLTDGGEDTRNPRGNPIKAAQDLSKVKNVRFHIVGFDINQPDWSQQLQEMAAKSGGKYWPAARGAELQQSVRNAVLGIPEQFSIIDSSGREVAKGRFGEGASLPEGKYHFHTHFAGQEFDNEFYMSPGEQTAVTFDASQLPAGPAPSVAAQSPAPPQAEQPPASWPKFCTHCGAPLKPGQKFCTKCGTPVQAK